MEERATACEVETPHAEKRKGSPFRRLLKRRDKRKASFSWGWTAAGALLLMLIAILPMLFVYLENTDAASFVAILRPIALGAAAYLAVYAIAVFLTLRPGLSALFTAVSVFFFVNFGTLTRLFAFAKSPSTLYALSFGALALIVLLMCLVTRLLRKQEQVVRVFSLMLSFVLLFLIGVNTIPALNAIQKDIQHAKEAREQSISAAQEVPRSMEEDAADMRERLRAAAQAAATPQPESEETPAPEETPLPEDKPKEVIHRDNPNVYILVLDEMGGIYEMEKYYNYDFTEFEAFCAANNINLSETTRTHHRDTRKCITDLVMLTRDGHGRNKNAYRMSKTAPLRVELEKLGYSLFNLSVSKGVFRDIPDLYDSMGVALDATTEDGLTMDDIAMEESVLQVLVNGSNVGDVAVYSAADEVMTTEQILSQDRYETLYWDGQRLLRNELLAFDFLSTPENLVPNSAIGILMYVKTTHVPFLFDAHGKLYEEDFNHRNWRDPEVYMGAYSFTLHRIQGVLENIIENDPDSIVYLVSDHGVRDHKEGVLKHEFDIPMEDQWNVFTLMYNRGKIVDIEGETPTNLMRMVLNELGCAFEMEAAE